MWPELTIVHGKPRHSQSPGSVERANQDIENMLTTWMQSNNTNKWNESLRFVQFMKNKASHSRIRSPYEAMIVKKTKLSISVHSMFRNLLAVEAIPNESITLRPAATAQSLITGEGFLKCICIKKCNTKRYYESAAKEINPNSDYKDKFLKKRIRSTSITFLEKPSETVQLNGKEKMYVETFLPIIDTLNTHLMQRSESYKEINERFSFFTQLQIIEADHLKKMQRIGRFLL
ncbi:hypothetical protein QTP88_009055 [Uroleucon formosanum]